MQMLVIAMKRLLCGFREERERALWYNVAEVKEVLAVQWWEMQETRTVKR